MFKFFHSSAPTVPVPTPGKLGRMNEISVPDQSGHELTTAATDAADQQGTGGRQKRRRRRRQRERRKGWSVEVRAGTLNVGTMAGKGKADRKE